MATFNWEISAGWAASALTFVALREATSKGTGSATVSTVEGVSIASGTIDLAAAGAGALTILLRDAAGNLVANERGTVDAAGAYTAGPSVDTEALAAAVVAGGGVTVYQPVATGGQITEPIVIGDDYLASHARAFAWNVEALPGVDAVDASCFFGAKDSNGNSFLVEGTVTDGDDEGTWDLSFDLAASDTDALPEGDYKWSVEVRDAANKEITRVRNADFNYRVKLVAKQT